MILCQLANAIKVPKYVLTYIWLELKKHFINYVEMIQVTSTHGNCMYFVNGVYMLHVKGGSRGFIFGTITFEITYVQCTRVVCTIFKGILRLLGQIVFFGGHIGGFKTLRKKKSTITRNQN